MSAESPRDEAVSAPQGQMVRPELWRANDRHVLLGVSHPSDDPVRHRTFEIRASYNADSGGWIARSGEQNLNEQRGDWSLIGAGEERSAVFPTAAACLGHAVASILAAVDQEADDEP